MAAMGFKTGAESAFEPIGLGTSAVQIQVRRALRAIMGTKAAANWKDFVGVAEGQYWLRSEMNPPGFWRKWFGGYSTEKQAASSRRLLNRKLDSRETSESNWLALFR